MISKDPAARPLLLCRFGSWWTFKRRLRNGEVTDLGLVWKTRREALAWVEGCARPCRLVKIEEEL